METIHIFDEFINKEDNDTTRHEKRIKLEPLIFDILKVKYYNIFDTFWKNNSVIKNTNKSIVIIERRIHENLAFLLRNMFYYAPSWAITVICSDINYNYIKDICTNNLNNITIIPLLKENPEREIARIEYNNILKSYSFYENIPYEHIFIVEMDSYLRKPIDETIFQYDYVAAPYSWDETSSGGGMSYRKRSVMLNICKQYISDIPMQDCYALEGIKTLGYKMPEFMDGITYIAESCFYDDPMGVHQWWTFFRVEDEYAEEILKNYLELEILKE
jgi:hypothetical protein